MKRIYTIIVTYNGMKWIEECLNSILNSSIPVFIIVVDNYSTDGTIKFIKENFSKIILLQQNENLGFGKANNIGISYALKHNADFVFLLNQDAFVDKNTIEKLIKVSFNKPEFGILSPIQLDYSGKLLENYFFKFMADDSSRTFYSDFVINNELKEIYDINFIQAAAWLLPTSTIKKIGGFDPLFYHYGEDDNYCQRARFHQIKIGVVPKAFIRHDSHKPKIMEIDLFSENYFSTFLREIYHKYGDINRQFGQVEVKKELEKYYKLFFLCVLKFNFKKASGYLKQIYLFKNKINNINLSRTKNKSRNLNYLDV
ncbi:glycosyltransferase family 2 protein [Flavobacterium sp. 123]|jgi:GT2 family glycosyltransferase|uniref:glycosyltransferase family 2 protein n=1 Tax=Flavobacterium sp. 123 TaxID=2135627 RepID=UPI000EAE3D44|nr:glycosyltransferase family 2 protein [Flavobacterium sp. 123]RKT00011.1 GT2 family glycosyltransferase [Flavobacterium sp. 123]